MKKTLYSTTFLATAGLLAVTGGDAFAQAAAPAAEKLKIGVGGSMTQWVGWAEQGSSWERASGVSYKNFDQKSDSEIHFTGSVKLDNGITASIVVQLEADRSTGGSQLATTVSGQTVGWTDYIDESYLKLTGAFGDVRLGSDNPATLYIGVSAPYIGVNPYNTDQFQWIVRELTATTGATPGTTGIGGGVDDNRVSYISPSLFGIRAAASYAASTIRSESQPLDSEVDTWDAGLQFAEKFGDFGLRVSATYWNVEDAARASGATDNWSVGADVTFADFTVGGGFAESKRKEVTAGAAGTGDVYHWNAGVKYAPGPLGVALTYQTAVADDTTANTDEDVVRRWTLGTSYILGPGVTALGNVLYHQFRPEDDAAADKKSSWAVIGGVQVDF